MIHMRILRQSPQHMQEQQLKKTHPTPRTCVHKKAKRPKIQKTQSNNKKHEKPQLQILGLICRGPRNSRSLFQTCGCFCNSQL